MVLYICVKFYLRQPQPIAHRPSSSFTGNKLNLMIPDCSSLKVCSLIRKSKESMYIISCRNKRKSVCIKKFSYFATISSATLGGALGELHRVCSTLWIGKLKDIYHQPRFVLQLPSSYHCHLETFFSLLIF